MGGSNICILISKKNWRIRSEKLLVRYFARKKQNLSICTLD